MGTFSIVLGVLVVGTLLSIMAWGEKKGIGMFTALIGVPAMLIFPALMVTAIIQWLFN